MFESAPTQEDDTEDELPMSQKRPPSKIWSEEEGRIAEGYRIRNKGHSIMVFVR